MPKTMGKRLRKLKKIRLHSEGKTTLLWSAIVLITRMLADQTIYVPEDIEGVVTVLGSIPTIEQDSAGRTWRVKIEKKVGHEA